MSFGLDVWLARAQNVVEWKVLLLGGLLGLLVVGAYFYGFLQAEKKFKKQNDYYTSRFRASYSGNTALVNAFLTGVKQGFVTANMTVFKQRWDNLYQEYVTQPYTFVLDGQSFDCNGSYLAEVVEANGSRFFCGTFGLEKLG